MIYFKKIACAGKYHDDQAIPDVIAYITRPDKTPSGFIYGVQVDMHDIAGSMIAVAKKFKKYSRLRLHHFIVSFEPDYKDRLDLLSEIATEVCCHIGRVYQIAAAVHEDTPYPHIHFVFNSVSFVNGYKYRGGIGEYHELVHDISSILGRHKLYPLVTVQYIPALDEPHE